MADQQLGYAEQQRILQQLAQEIGPVPKNTPLAQVVGKIGGGILGWLIAKYFKMGIIGQTISAVAGYGIGKQIGNFYNMITNQASPPGLSPSPFHPFG